MDRSLMPLHQCDVPVFHVCPVDPACPYCNGSTYGESAGAFDWSFLDGTYCISLKSRPDRVASAAAEFHRLGLCRHVLFYRPSKDPERPKRGIWESHRAVAEHARQRGFETTLILEDDVLFSRRLQPQKVRAIARALNTLPPDWMVFFLGHWPFWAYFAGPNMLRTGSACAHAYVASTRLLQWLHDHPYGSRDILWAPRIVGRGIDAAYARLEATYALFPMIAIQSGSRSDNIKDEPTRTKKGKLRRLVVRRWKHREWLLSNFMRTNELAILLLSPLTLALHVAVSLVLNLARFGVLSKPRPKRA
jgi:hypothetical protein